MDFQKNYGRIFILMQLKQPNKVEVTCFYNIYAYSLLAQAHLHIAQHCTSVHSLASMQWENKGDSLTLSC